MSNKLKDRFLTPDSVGVFAETLSAATRRFDKNRFLTLVFDDQFEDRELMARMRHITRCLHQNLPRSYAQSLNILKKAAPQTSGFEAASLPDFVELYGQDDWDRSLPALAYFTEYFSSEFAIRPYIIADAQRTMAFMTDLADSPSANVRRFASEGCRPRLPWAVALPEFKADPGMILPILEKLRDDDSEFVRKSVANNLNDISKDHPEMVLDLCERWHGHSDNTDWIIKHGCRTLLKAGNRRAMMLFGFGNPQKIDVRQLKLDHKRIAIGQKVQFSFTVNVRTGRARKVRLEYAVYFARANGRVSKKVFQISEKSLAPGEHTIRKKHAFADLSTRKHHPGKQEIAVIVNGVEKARTELILKA